MLPKEIKEQIAGEAAKLCKTPLEDSEIYMSYEMGATAWAEKMIGFLEWADKNNYARDTKNIDPKVRGKWYKVSGVTEGKLNFTGAELLVYYINQIKK